MESFIAGIMPAVIILGGMGLLFGVGLGAAGKRFAVRDDEVTGAVLRLLPGANCGSCGFAGCDQLAKAIAEGRAAYSACPVGGSVCASAIAEVFGLTAQEASRTAAFARCFGGGSKTARRYEYAEGDCWSMSMLSGGGAASCPCGCLGMGSCVKACPRGAISTVDGIAVIDCSLCVSCGRCVKACPRGIIGIFPAQVVRVGCMSRKRGKAVRDICKSGCIACGMCERECPFGAIKVIDNLAEISYDRCTSCGKCAAICPVKAIKTTEERVDSL